jgi:hypothetical protein
LKAKKMDPFGAVTKAEERKRRLEGGPLCESAGVDFMPLAMDTFGGFGPSATEALEVVADQIRTLKGEEEDEKEYKAKRIAQKLRVVMLRFVARQILSRTNVDRIEDGEKDACEKDFEWQEEEEEGTQEEELTDQESPSGKEEKDTESNHGNDWQGDLKQDDDAKKKGKKEAAQSTPKGNKEEAS